MNVAFVVDIVVQIIVKYCVASFLMRQQFEWDKINSKLTGTKLYPIKKSDNKAFVPLFVFEMLNYENNQTLFNMIN